MMKVTSLYKQYIVNGAFMGQGKWGVWQVQKKKENSMTEACGLTNTQVVHTSDMTTATCVSLLAQYTHMNVMYSIIKLTCKNNTLCSIPFLHQERITQYHVH